jgi:hypothetical protein
MVYFNKDIDRKFAEFIVANISFAQTIRSPKRLYSFVPEGEQYYEFTVQIENIPHKCYAYLNAPLVFKEIKIEEVNSHSFLVKILIDKYEIKVRQFTHNRFINDFENELGLKIIKKIIETMYFDNREDIFDYKKTRRNEWY